MDPQPSGRYLHQREALALREGGGSREKWKGSGEVTAWSGTCSDWEQEGSPVSVLKLKHSVLNHPLIVLGLLVLFP